VAGELQETNARLHQLQEEKNRLYARISHDLRAPLNSVLGTCNLMSDQVYGPMTERQTHAMNRVERNTRVMLQLIDGILQLSRLDSGLITLIPETFTLESLFQELVENLRPLAEHKGLRMTVQLEDSLPPLHTDRGKLYQILQNLIGNAIQFTHEGTVTLSAQSQDSDTLAIAVRDSGPGIKPEDQEKIFQAFTRGEHSSSHESGVGLGLAISREFTHLLGGTIHLDSQIGVGSAFTIVLPVQSPQPKSIAQTV
jgi:signal transduction histidine kinase